MAAFEVKKCAGFEKLTTISDRTYSQPIINFKETHFTPLIQSTNTALPNSHSKMEEEEFKQGRPKRSFSFSDEAQEVSTASGEDLI
jgi:hypothetical protein